MRNYVMHVDPIFAATKHARPVVAFKRLTALLAPFANIRRGLTATPEVASFAGVSHGLQLGVTHSAAYLAFLRCRSLESGIAHRASDAGCTSAAPAPSPVASLGAEPVSVVLDARSSPIERFAALLAHKVSAVLRPVERLAADTFVPWRRAAHRGIVSFPTANSLPPAEPPEDDRMADLFTDMAAD
jgi:hypothetical protein